MSDWSQSISFGGPNWAGQPPIVTLNQFNSTVTAITSSIDSILSTGGTSLWATFPAVQDVDVAGFKIYNANTLSTMALNVSSLNGAIINVGGIVINNSTITNGGGTTINGGNITNCNTTTAENTKSESYTVSDIVNSVGTAVDTITDAAEAAGGVFGSVQTAAQVASVAYGVGTIANGVSAANGVVDLATKGASLFTTRTEKTITGPAGPPGLTTPVYETINGTTQLQFSTLGIPTFTVFRTTDQANPNQLFGNEVFVSTIISAGTKCVRSVSDPLQFVILSTVLRSTLNFLQSFGQWSPILADDNNLNANTASISSLTVSSIYGNFISTGRLLTTKINDSINVINSNICNVGQFQANNGIFSNAIIVTNNAQVGSLTSGGAISGTSGSFSGNVGVNILNAVGAVNGATAVITGSISGGSLFTLNNTVTGTLAATSAVIGALTVSGAAGVGSLSITGTTTAATVNATSISNSGIIVSDAISTNSVSTAFAFISSINGLDVTTFGASATTLPFLSTSLISSGTAAISSIFTNSISSGTARIGSISTISISSGTAVIGSISTNLFSTAESFISSINGLSFASLVNPAPTATISTFLQLFTSSFQTNHISSGVGLISSLQTTNISSGVGFVNQLYTSSIFANNISSGVGLINQLYTSSIFANNISSGVGLINQLYTSSIFGNNISTGNLQSGIFSASTITSPLNFSLVSTVANQADIAGVNITLLKSFIGLTSPIPLLNLTNQGGVPQVFNDANFSYWNQCAFQAPTGSPDVYAVSLSALVVNTSGQVDFYFGSATTIQINYPGGSTIIGDFGSGFPGQARFTFATGVWTFTNSFAGGSVSNSNNLQISQDVSQTLIQTTDSLIISTALLDILAPTSFKTLIAQKFNASSISSFNVFTGTLTSPLFFGSNMFTTNLTGTTINTLTANTTTLNGATILCSSITTSNILNSDAVLVQKFQGNTPLSFNALTNQYVTLSGGLSGTNGRAQTNQINFLALPGMVDAGIPNGFPNGTTLTFTPAGLTLLNGNPGFPSLWFSSITSVDNSLTTKIVNFQLPTGGNGQVALLTNGIANVTIQSNGTNFGIVTTTGYSKLSWTTSVFSIQNVGSFSPYLSTLVTQDTRIQTGANNAMNLINKQTLFNGKAPVVFFQNFTGFFVGSPTGSASAGGVLSFGGSNFATNAYSCYLSFYNINLAQNNLAINNFNVTATAIGSNWGAYCYTGIATVAGGLTTGVNWNVQCMMVPKEFALSQNFNKFGEEPPESDFPPSTFTSTIANFSRLNLPEVLVSSITASTIVFEASENMSLLAGIPIPGYFGVGNVTIAGTASVEIIGDQAVIGGLTDVDIEAVNRDVIITAASTISLFGYNTLLSNAGDIDLYGGSNKRVRLYANNINIEDGTGNIINFGSNVYDSFTNIGRQRVKYGTVGISNIMDITNLDGHININGDSNNVILTGQNFTLTDPVSGGFGSFTVDSNGSLYWNGNFIV